MAEQNLGKVTDAIIRLREENATQSKEMISKQSSASESLRDIATLLREQMKMTQRGMLDAEEARRKKKPEAAGPKGSSEKPETEEPEFGLKGILQILAGIGAAVAGFATGLVQGFGRILNLVTKRFLAPFRAIADVFKKRGTSKFLKGETYKTLGRTTEFFRRMADRFDDLEKATKRAIKESKRLQKVILFFQKIRSYAGMIGNIVKDLGKLGIEKIAKPFKDFGKFIANIQRAVVGLPSPKEASALSGLISKITTPFKNFINGVRGVGESTSKIAKTMKSFFGAFKVIGRFVAFPLTVVMGLIDSFKGARDNMEGRVGAFDKILSGAIGAIAGLIKGLILVPIDLLKSGISWVAKKLGFENFANLLDSFSFADSFMEFTSRLTDGFIYTFRNAIDSIMKPFEDGVDLGSILEFVVTLPYKIVTSLLDLTKSAVGSLLGLFGATDAEEALGSFSFTDMFDSLIQFVKELPTRLANALLSFFEDPIGAIKDGLQIAGDFASMAGAKIKSLLVGLLPDPDSLVANLVPDALYEWANEPPPAPPEPVVADVPATETQNPISRSEEPQEIRGVDEDGFEYIERRRPASMDRPASTAIAGTRDIYGEEFIDPVTGESRRQTVFEADPMIAAKLQKDNDEFFAEMDRLEAAKNTRGQDLDQMSRTNAQAASSGMNVVVSAPNQTSTTTNNSNTAAIIDQNLPTVDTNDRSWAM